jgi:hypothetical protein
LRCANTTFAGRIGRWTCRVPRRLGQRLRREANREPRRLTFVVDDKSWAVSFRGVDAEVDRLEQKIDQVVRSDELELDPTSAARGSTPRARETIRR